MTTIRRPIINHWRSYVLLVLLYMVLTPFFAIAQKDSIYIDPNQTAQVLASNLAGPGIVITNAQLTCPTDASGTFVSVKSNIGLDSGVILTTGRAKTETFMRWYGLVTLDGANSNALAMAHWQHFTPGDADLTNYSGLPTNDACALEFDFKAQGDSMKFEYVFASEEYTMYSCSIYNDAFAFFISGPGITGRKNIGVIPGTSIPVSVNSTTDTMVNSPNSYPKCSGMGTGSPFSSYYINNLDPLPGRTVTYDGFTKVITAISAVQPCSTYHLKLVIADGMDAKLDSGVWLKANSLSSNLPKVTPVSSTGAANDVPAAIRGCKPAKFVFSRTYAGADPVVVKYVIGGTAINGYDYTRIADSAIIMPGSKTAEVEIDAQTVGTTTGVKVVKVYLYSPYDCDPVKKPIDSAAIEIWDELKLILNNKDTAICKGESVLTSATGEVDYTYIWSPTDGVNNTSSINTMITPDTTATYTVTASYTGCKDVSRSFVIDVQPNPVVEAGEDIELCKGALKTLTASVSPGWYGKYTYHWYPADDLSSATGKSVDIIGDADTKIYVRVETPVGCWGMDSLFVDVLPYDFAYIVSDSLGLCPNDSLDIEVGGGNTYTWQPYQYISDTTSARVRVYPIADMLYDVTVVSDKGCLDTLRVPVEVYPGAVLYLGPDVTLYPGEYHQMDPGGNCEYIKWFPEVGLSSPYSRNPIAQPNVYTRYFAQGTTIYGCKTSDTIDIYLERTILDVPNAFNPTGYDNKELKIIKRGIATLKYFRIFNRWGEAVFETNDIEKGWDGKYNGVDQPVGVYVYMVEAVTDDGRPFVQQGNITLLR